MTAKMYRLPASEPQGIMAGRSGPQLVCFAGLFSVGLVGALAGLWLVAFVFWLAAGAMLTRPGGEPAPSWIALFGRVGWRRLAGGSEWWGVPVSGSVDAVTGEMTPVTVGMHPLLSGFVVESVPESVGLGPVGLVRDVKRNRVTVFLPVGGKQFALATDEYRDGAVAAWGAAMAQLAGRRGVAQISWSAAGCPQGIEQHWAWVDAQGGGDAAQMGLYRDLVTAVAGQGLLEHSVTVSITVERSRLRLRRRPGGPSVAEQMAIEAVAAAAEVSRSLETVGCQPGGLLDADGIGALIRSRVDAPAAAVWRDATAGVGSPVDAVAAWPGHVREENDYVEVDGRFHTALVVRQWPRLGVAAGWLEPLMRFAGSHRVMTVGFEPINPAKSDRDLRAAFMGMRSDAQLKAESGRRLTARAKTAMREAERLEAELQAGYREVRWWGVVVVSASSLDELRDGVDAFASHARNSHVDVRPLWGRQVAGWVLGAGVGAVPGSVW